MAETQSHTPGVIRSTKDYLRGSVSPPPGSPDNSNEAQPRSPLSTFSGDDDSPTISTSRDNPREIRNKAEKQRRDKLNQSISELASMVPPVVAAKRKMDKTGILRLTAHYLRAHQYVFGDSVQQSEPEFSAGSSQALLGMLNGFLLTTTYRGLIVVVSQNVQQFLGYTELELLGQNILNITHEDDRQKFRDQLMPNSNLLGPNGELLIPNEPEGKHKVEEALANEKRRFAIRFKKLGQRSQPSQYLTCHIEGSLRKSDRACRGYNRCCQMVRRARARGDNPCSSGNDIVFIGIVRPTSETFMSESGLESFKMEYRTRHSIDGEIIQCEQRIALVTGYMMHEVNGVNAMNFMHRDDVRFVIIALREMYDQHRLFGESCYRLMTKNGQLIYMRTRGRLDVDPESRAVTSFVCTNTVVGEEEGKHLIQLMKKKFTLMVNNNEDYHEDEEDKEVTDNSIAPVEDPRQLEKVILNLVTNLPSPAMESNPRISPERVSPSLRLAIIPPKKERIVSAIEKIYSVIKSIQKQPQRKLTTPDIRTIENMKKVTNVFSDDNAKSCTNSQSPKHTHQTGSLISEELINLNHSREQSGHSNVSNLFPPQNIHYFAKSSLPEMYTKMTTVSFSNINDNTAHDNTTATKIKYHVYITPRVNINDVEGQTEPNTIAEVVEPGPSKTPVGIKRPNGFEYEDVGAKKKILEAVKQSEISGQDSPTLETFFDEAMLNTQIESAINSLEQAIDPSFPDLLISSEVQDILGEIEDVQNEEQHPEQQFY